MDASVNNQPIMFTDLILPFQGRWTAEIRADVSDPLSRGDTVTIHLLGQDYVGTVVSGGVLGGMTRIWAVGGKAGIDQVLSPKHYRNGIPVSAVWQDLIQESGEAFSADSSNEILTTLLPKWTRTKTTGLNLLAELAAHVGALWRTMPNGQFWIGKDTFVPSPSAEWDLVAGSPESERIVIATEEARFLPGQSLDGLRIKSIKHVVTDSQSRSVLNLWTS